MQFGENYLTNLDEPNRKLAQSYGLLDKGSGSHCGRGRGRGSAVNLAQKQPDIQFLQHKSFHCMNNMSMPMYASQPDNFWDSMTVNNLSAMDTAMKTIISQERYRRSRSRSVERRRNIRKKAKLST